MIEVPNGDWERKVISSLDRKLTKSMIDGMRAKLMDNLESSLKKKKVETQVGEQGQLGYIEHG
jgi:hypothetical protein